MKQFRVLADANIPCVEEAFGDFGPVRRQPGREIGPADVQEADVLLVRSVTPVRSELLEQSDVCFVGSATIGTDHVDRAYLSDQDIAFAHAPASNADSVADYVVVALLELARRAGESLQEKRVGIVGCGNIGGRLASRLPAFGMRILHNDPPRAETAGEDAPDFVPLDTVLTEADVVTLHVPLTTTGPHPTYHLLNAEAFGRMKSGAWLVNTSRGPVVDGDALLNARTNGSLGAAVLDVWENEPTPDPALINTVDLATPHIAGYAYDGKVRGTAMLYRAFCEHVGVTPSWHPAEVLTPESPHTLRCDPPDPRLPSPDWLYALARQAYDLRVDHAHMRSLLHHEPDARGKAFTHFRADYRRRRELQQHSVRRTALPAGCLRAVEEGLTIQAE